jgi:5-methylcytosine-specific restriction endonuclease McrA
MSVTPIPPKLRDAVRERAGGMCEYCRYPDIASYATFNCDHCVPEAAGGPTTIANLAWACPTCNASKGGSVEAPDPLTGQRAAVFNPRLHSWNEHFH